MGLLRLGPSACLSSRWEGRLGDRMISWVFREASTWGWEREEGCRQRRKRELLSRRQSSLGSCAVVGSGQVDLVARYRAWLGKCRVQRRELERTWRGLS